MTRNRLSRSTRRHVRNEKGLIRAKFGRESTEAIEKIKALMVKAFTPRKKSLTAK